MNVKILFRTVCSAIIGLFVLSGCNNDFDNGLITSIHLRDKFNQTEDNFISGDEINMSLSIKNDSTLDKTLDFTSGYQYDFVITDQSNNEIWRWSADLSFIQEPTSFTLGPTDIQTITYTWNQHIDADATFIPAGSYIIEGYFVGNDPTAQTTFTIQ